MKSFSIVVSEIDKFLNKVQEEKRPFTPEELNWLEEKRKEMILVSMQELFVDNQTIEKQLDRLALRKLEIEKPFFKKEISFTPVVETTGAKVTMLSEEDEVLPEEKIDEEKVEEKKDLVEEPTDTNTIEETKKKPATRKKTTK